MVAHNRKSTEEVVRKFVEVHGDKYDYSKVDYVGDKVKVAILCKKHNEYFYKIASSHIARKSGCPLCRSERRSREQAFTTEQFIQKSQESHGVGKFDYSRVDYKTARIKVEIGCNTCGNVFFQTPFKHTKGFGCSKCRDIKLAKERSHTKEKFIEEAKKVDLGRYCYDRVAYKNARTYVDILCKTCNKVFKKKPTEILNGLGCSCFAQPLGYKPKLQGTLYIIQCGEITKIGITNWTAAERAKAISKSYGDTFSVVKEYKLDGQVCTDTETTLLKMLRAKYKSPTTKYDGYTESFLNVDIVSLTEDIENLIGGQYE